MKQLFQLCLCLLVFTAQAQSGTTLTGSIRAGGRVRDYRLYVPPSYQPGRATPLLFNLQCYGSNNLSQERYGDFRAIADTAGFLIVHPNGTIDPGTSYLYWNAWNQSGGPDDVAFLAALFDTLAQRYTMDPDRLYSAGYSNGGFMSYELACHLGARVAAVASVCGSMETGQPGTCRSAHPMPVLEIHGTGDTNVTYTGGSWFVSIPTVLNYWVQANGCNPVPVVTAVPDIDPTDNTTAEHSVRRGPRVGAVVEHFRVLNRGHVWPGGPPSSTDVVNRDISASREVWRFLRRYRLSRLGLVAVPAGGPASVSIFPNPVGEAATVVLRAGPGLRPPQVRAYDALGRAVPLAATAGPGGAVQLDVRSWPAGVYGLRVADDAAGSRWVRLVK
ncbi:PHB depolymerase family esterase [Hymenobacter sp. ASUV-10]|uniref:PHB depolymerase family esterase n=1 Tax=Hymenobacter aranciens TaxID=3063996 RepID=A0ABT9BG40_9BACT|nr:PHB depolymerase family esterase [Hymenobacter sp. ASUV-10]MDO7877229.1 PHB depolymerase family esterase [Hymenobacter sp. ASUV-10]